MILYHFTDFWSLENAGPDAILKAGLKACDPNKDYPMFGGKLRPCVWFTSQPEFALKRKHQEVRITVELSRASKRLISWPMLLRRLRSFNEAGTHYALGIERFEDMEREKSLRLELGREPTDAELRAWRYWWVYLGDVPLKAIRAVEYSDEARNDEARLSGLAMDIFGR